MRNQEKTQVVHGYSGRKGQDNRISNSPEWRELNSLVQANDQHVFVNHLTLSVGGIYQEFEVSDAGVTAALAAAKQKWSQSRPS